MAARRRPVSIAATAVWLVFWGAAMIVAVTVLVGAVREGAVVPALFLLVWLGVAGVGLWSVGWRLFERLIGERLRPPAKPRPRQGRHDWRDDMPGPRP